MAETWILSGGGWTKTSPAHSPAARTLFAFSAAAAPTLFGGSSPSGLLNDTWSWNGSDWHQLATTTSPVARRDAACAGDGQQMLMFSGDAGGGVFPSDLWSVSSDWTRLA
jgi:hypothetical protein